MNFVIFIFFYLLSYTLSLSILTPYQSVLPHTISTFGPNYYNNSIVGNLIESVPFDACQPLTINSTGKIVLAIRGGSPSCSFSTKVRNVLFHEWIINRLNYQML